jgi:two-component system cell cycle sensor histidine kinase/response regulator CckA
VTESDSTARAQTSDTILVLEDDAAIRKALVRVLERAGYVALGASTPVEAIELAADPEVPLRLLITDFSFHAVNGRQIADILLRDRPALRVLFISGHAESEVLPREGRRAGMAFLQKPFSMDALVQQVRDQLQ